MLVSLSSTSPPRAYCSISNPLLKLPALRPVSTQEEKHWIGLGAFPSCIIHTARPKKLKILQLFIIGSCIGSNLNSKLIPKAHARVQFYSGSVRSHAYFPEWKPTLTITVLLLYTDGRFNSSF